MNRHPSAIQRVPIFLHLPPPRRWNTDGAMPQVRGLVPHEVCAITKGLFAEGKSDVVLSLMQADT